MKSRNPVTLALLGIPALVYGTAVRWRNRRYGRRGPVRRADLPVLSIGNLTVGGTGKTTMASWLTARLGERGRRPAVVSRGYMGGAGRGPVVVCDGTGPLVGPETAGDEPYLLALKHPNAVIVVGSDRWAGTSVAHRLQADVVILDDGFQHRRLARDLDIVLLDAHNPFGNYRLLPAGTLREPASALGRADVVVITRSRPRENFVVLERVIRRYNPRAPILRAGHVRRGYSDAAGRDRPRPDPVVAFCGIGNPDAFVTDLEAEGLHVVAFHPYRDHHAYDLADWSRLADEARRKGATLVTTEKDMVRIPPAVRRPDDPPLVALRIEATVHDEATLLDHVDDALGRRS